jgi:hypothetical protein
MAFVVEYVMKRTDTSVEFPLLSEKDQLAIEKLRETHNIDSSISISDDGLTWTMIQTTEEMTDYSAYYESAGKHWDKSKIVARCTENDIHLTMDIIENT